MEIKELLIDEEATMIEAMRQLDKAAKKVLFVAKNNFFAATITDGDIRRWILRKGNFEAKVKDIANYDPKYLLEEEKFKSKEYMKKHSIEALPIIDKENNVVSVIFWNEEVGLKKNINIPVVIMAGGLGTRLYPYTKILPKPLIPIGEIPIVEHIINNFNQHGSDQFYLVVNHKKNMIKAYFNEIEKPYTVAYVDENKPLGTGGGLSLLKGMINTTFVLTNCDILIKGDYEKILNYHKNEQNQVTMVCSLKNIRIPYGVVEVSETGEIDTMNEKPEISFLANTGMYIVEPRIIEELEENVAIGFPEIIERYKLKGQKIGIYPISENSWLDMGQVDGIEEMRAKVERNE